MAFKKISKTAKTANDETINNSLRMPPQNIEAEMSVLGSLMLDGKSVTRVVDVLNPEDFYRLPHRHIYEAMLTLFGKREPIDLLSVSSRLKEYGLLDEIGGMSYLTLLVNSVPTASNVAHYADIVRKKAILRSLIDVSGEIAQLGYKEDEDVGLLVDDAEKKIYNIAHRSLRQNFLPVKSALNEAWDRIERLHEHKGELRGVKTGFMGLDNLLSGLQKSDLIILAARPSFGKTAMALDIARNVALSEKRPVGIFSLEMSVEQLVDRFISAEAHINLQSLRNGRLSADHDDFTRIQDALSKLAEAPIFIDDEGSNTILQMRAMARRLQAEERDLGLIVVDYLQLIQPQRGAIDNMVQHITEVSRSLKALAKELNIPVLALAQLSRAVEQRGGKPRLSDLRDSGSIEQDADVVMFIHREDKAQRYDDGERKNQADILVEKHRNGPTGMSTLYFNSEIASFSNLESNQYGQHSA